MKKTFLIDKNRLYSEVDYSAVLSNKKYNGISVNVVLLNPIEITSGAVSLFDAYDKVGKTVPFMQNFPKGFYTPFAVIVDTSQGRRIAACGINLTPKQSVAVKGKQEEKQKYPDEWKTALFEEKDVIKLSLSGGGVNSFSGSGVFCLGDFVAAREYVSEVNVNQNSFHPLDTLVRLDGETAVNYNLKSGIAVFSTGWGEGKYPSFIGFSGGVPTALICDFLMFDIPYNKSKSGEKIEFVFDIAIEELYQDDPLLSDNENAIQKWSLVIGFANEIDELSLFNAYSRRGFAYHRAGKLDKALEDYNRAINISEKLTDEKGMSLHVWTIYDNIGNIYRTKGEIQKAIAVFQKAKCFSDNFYSGAYTSLIDIYLSQKNATEAIKIATEMIEARPQDPNGYIKRTESFVATLEYASAIKDLDVLISQFEQYEFIIDKATYLSKLSRNDEALELLDSFLEYSKPTDQYYYTKGLLYYTKKDIDNSIECLENALKENQDYLPAIVMLIEIEDLCFNHEAILSLSGRYIEQRPTSEYGYATRANAYFAMKKYSLAIDDYISILNFASDAKILRRLVICLIRQRNFAAAKKNLKELKKLDEAYFLNVTGHLCLAKKHAVTAERLMTNAFNKNPNETFLGDIIDTLAVCGKIEKAQSLVGKLKKLDNASALPILLESKINHLRGEENAREIAALHYIAKFLFTLKSDTRIKCVLREFSL